MRKTIMNKAVLMWAALTAAPVLAAGKPNVVILVTHESGGAVAPATRPATPNLDAWAKAGVTFPNAYAASPQAGPSDVAMLTGRYPQRAGFEIDPTATAGTPLPKVDAGQPTLAQSLKAAGYATAAFTNEPADAVAVGNGFDQVERAAAAPVDGAATYIQSHAAQPFLAFASVRLTGADLDAKLARITSVLRDPAVSDHTLFVLVRERHESPWSLHGDGLRGPWIISRPGVIPAGREVQQTVGAVDLAPTILAALNVAPGSDHPLDGTSQLPLVLNPDGEPADRPVYWRLGPQYGVQQGDWKLVKSSSHEAGPRLYYLGNDPQESLDLFKQQKQRAVALQALWDAWNAGNQPPRWTDPRWEEGQLVGDDSGTAVAGRFGPFKNNDTVQGKKAPAVAGKNLAISAEVGSDGSDGVIVSQGGAAHGYAIYVLGGKLEFAVRESGTLTSIAASDPLGKGDFKIRATLKDHGKLALWVNGKQVATGEAAGLLPQQPKAGLFVGTAGPASVGNSPSPAVFKGQVKDLTIKVE